MEHSENGSVSLTQEELDLALARRAKVPLDKDEVDALREVIAWFRQRKKEQEAADLARERRAKRYPILFGAISALVAIGSLVVNMLSGKHP